MPSATTAPLREQYDREGYVMARNVLDADLVGEVRDHVQWLRERNPGLRPENLGHSLMTRDAFWVRLISDDRLLDVAEQFIGPNMALFASHYIAKPPNDGQPVLWHQDGSYWPLEPMDVVTLWLAASESTPDNGCMRVIPRTQHINLQQNIARHDVANVLHSSMDEKTFAALGVDQSAAVDIELQPGDVSIHHPHIVHGSNANTSDRWRYGLTIRYIPTTTRITQMPWPSAFALRGGKVAGVNDYHPWPKYDPATSMDFADRDAWDTKVAATAEAAG